MKIINEIKNSKQKGLALDIDETLSRTNYWWIERLQELFGNPEELTKEEIVKKYRYTQNVPHWQTEEALGWMHEHRESNEVQTELPLIEGAQESVQRISKIVPIVVYITSRPETVIDGTEKWLQEHNFPQVPVIARPSSVDHADGNRWKASVLKELEENVQCSRYCR